MRSRPGIALTPAGVVRLDLEAAADPQAREDSEGGRGGGPSGAMGRDLDLLARVNAWLAQLGEDLAPQNSEAKC